MGFFDKLVNKLFKRKKQNALPEAIEITHEIQASNESATNVHADENIEFPEGELVPFSNEVIDTNSRVSQEKFKHNLEILIKNAKRDGKIDKFMIIRDDDFLPEDWEWRVLSKDTNLEPEVTALSFELRKAIALEKKGIAPYVEIMGTKVPNSSVNMGEILSDVDKLTGAVLMPSRFRSTKHFTVNTPLGVTGNYNSVQDNRDFTVIDNMDAFLASGYAYSVSYHDAYLDVSHEGLPVSEDAVVLINDEKYDRIMQDAKISSELAKRKVVRYKVEEYLAVEMVLTEMGALPSQVGWHYAQYDQELRDILDSSIQNLATENNLFFDKSHGGELKPTGGHFSNYYDEKNPDYNEAQKRFIDFLKKKFPEYEAQFSSDTRISQSVAEDLISNLGTSSVLNAINEYNEQEKNDFDKKHQIYKEDRKNITPIEHEVFTATITSINEFYKTDTEYASYDEKVKIEEVIRRFLQSGTVDEQMTAARDVCKVLLDKVRVEKESKIQNDEVKKAEVQPEHFESDIKEER